MRFSRLGEGRIRVFDEVRRYRIVGRSLEDFTENGHTFGIGGIGGLEGSGIALIKDNGYQPNNLF